MTIDKEYTSDSFVGFLFTSLMAFPRSRSSGAQYRNVQPWWGVEALADSMFLVIEQSPKSVRSGEPLASISIFGWNRWYVSREELKEKLEEEILITLFKSPWITSLSCR